LTPDAGRVQQVLERLFAGGVGADDRRRELFPVAIGWKEGRALRNWVLKERARRTLETGLGFGIATLFICDGLIENGSDGQHVAIDPYQHEGLPGQTTRFRGAGLEILEEAGVRHLVDFHAEESQIVLPRLLTDGRSFDLAFLDGNHRFEGVFLDLIYSGRLLKDRGLVFVDDTQLPGVARAVDFCVRNLDWVVEERGEETSFHQWLVLRTSSQAVFQRPFAQFVDF
jgi:predicted O-methyltransferase YrrM